MKAIIPALLLLLVAGTAQAEWVKVAESPQAIAYFNPATLEKDGDFRKVWEIHDYKRRDADGEMSLRLHMEYNCKDAAYRLLGFSTHSEAMAEGATLVSNSTAGEWMPVRPNSLVAANLKLVCGL